ncbi:PKHD-type hydroxylase [Variibacter gotjawalensis]|uniref:PKHD-type hydroxylase n=1 Tax=Variibacter gotjawalensis TaxID=1333996 RepID=A0A0S3PZL6_9BRAD|nr:Fe2+-dependent dioxygenase [Variibacter gotjawalensis]NIK47005.1 PKHD-type hydroxylase [Variibacter gotjawalensis]RZS48909.1 PKHD-type hydroxylase [Variibacter gotjawalensis]BAT61168.1 PKHD-type hydroxylase [Variibacter gotjawalensis]
MQIVIQDVLDAAEVKRARAAIAKAKFVDGRETAGWAAKGVKRNEQASALDATLDPIRKLVTDRIAKNSLFAMAVRAKQLSPLLFSRYKGEMHYGSHVDDAIMQGMRVDISFTLFLADPSKYDGGELVIESTSGEETFKLEAGSMIVYPATTLHRVEPVTRGERIAAVGWARSFIRDPAQRELLFDLDTARRVVFERDGKSPAFDLMSKSLANLVRMWADD